jgi:hypothetical protein
MKQSERIGLLILSDSSNLRLMQLKIAVVEDTPISTDKVALSKSCYL